MHDRPDTHGALPDWFGVPAAEPPPSQPAEPWLGTARVHVPQGMGASSRPIPAGDGFVIAPAAPDAPPAFSSADDGRMGMYDGVVGMHVAAPLEHSTAAWSFHTPDGLQTLLPGGSVATGGGHPFVSRAFGGPAVPSLAHTHAGTDAAHRGAAATAGAPSARPQRTRIRWETVVPTITVACLLGAIGLVIADFDVVRSGGGGMSHGHAGSTTANHGATSTSHGPVGTNSARAVDSARALLRSGEYDRASVALEPALTGRPSDDVIALRDAIIDGSGQDAALRRQLTSARANNDPAAVLTTLWKLEQLHPLTPGQRRVRAATLRTVAMRAAARRAAAGAKLQYGSQSPRPSPGTSHARRTARIAPAPPRAGGTSTGGGGPTPPGPNVSAGAMPPVPQVPNTAGPSGGGSVSGQPDTTSSPSTGHGGSMAGMKM